MKKLVKNESQRAVSIDLIEDVCWKKNTLENLLLDLLY